MNPGPLDVRPDDLPAAHMLGDDVLDTLRVHPIIQSRCAPRARDGGKPAPQHRRRARREISLTRTFGPWVAPSETALPQKLGVLARTVRFERRAKHLVERFGSAVTATLGPRQITILNRRRTTRPRA